MKTIRIHTSIKSVSLMMAVVLSSSTLFTGCATTKGAVYGAGIGALAGDAEKGARIGASVGAVVDIID